MHIHARFTHSIFVLFIMNLNCFQLKFSGVYLPDLCSKQRSSPHRAMIELLSSGAAAATDASAPISSEDIIVGAPDISPASF